MLPFSFRIGQSARARISIYDLLVCHATDGPPKMGPPGPSVANYVAMDGPPGPSTAAIDGPPGSPVAP